MGILVSAGAAARFTGPVWGEGGTLEIAQSATETANTVQRKTFEGQYFCGSAKNILQHFCG